MARIRTFIAVEISREIRLNCELLQRQLADANLPAKWTTAADLHVTLHFLGEIHERETAGVCNVLTRVAKKHHAFPLTVGGLGAFPNVRRPKTLWAGLSAGIEELTAIHEALRDPLGDLGVYRHEDRRYTPHLTLGRVKADEESDAAAIEIAKYRDWVGGTTMVEEILLFRSDNSKTGPEYSLLGRGVLK
jgi:2'-5' RNA ligase